jgi:hypothetical protein
VLRAYNRQFSGGIAKFDAEILNPEPGATDLAYVEKLNDCQYRVTMGTDFSGSLVDIYQVLDLLTEIQFRFRYK